MIPDELRALATKVEHGTATNKLVWYAVGFRRTEGKDGVTWCTPDNEYIAHAKLPKFMTSIDAQIKYLPMPGWDRHSYTEEHGNTCFMKKRQSLEDRLDLTVPLNPSVQGGGLNVSREAAELACTLRAMAWEKENKK